MHFSLYLAAREFAPQKLSLCKGRRRCQSDDLDGYITGAFGTLAMPMTAISGGAAAVNDVLQGTDSFGETKEKMHVMKTFTPEDVQTYAAMFDKLAEQGVKLCIGSAAEIEKNAEMFDTIVTDWAE